MNIMAENINKTTLNISQQLLNHNHVSLSEFQSWENLRKIHTIQIIFSYLEIIINFLFSIRNYIKKLLIKNFLKNHIGKINFFKKI